MAGKENAVKKYVVRLSSDEREQLQILYRRLESASTRRAIDR
jgi:hypothetical protein